MLERLYFLAAAGREFALETTPAGRGHGRWLSELRAADYRGHLIFLSLPSAELAVARVAERVRQGRHDVTEHIVKRRFAAGIRSLFAHYLHAVDGWQVYDNSSLAGPRLIASRNAGETTVVVDAAAWRNLVEQQR